MQEKAAVSIKPSAVSGIKNADQLAMTEALINELICPPPPSCSTYKLNNDTIDSLIVPAPEKLAENIEIVPKKDELVFNGLFFFQIFLNWFFFKLIFNFCEEIKLKRQNGKAYLQGPCDDTIKSLLQECERINLICRMETDFVEQPFEEQASARIKPLTNAQKLRKVIFELVETEKNYVKVNFKEETKI